MIDALLFAVRDAIINGDFGWDARVVSIRPDGQPAPFQGDVAVIVHEGASRSDMDNALNEYFAFAVTLTMRVAVPWDRIGDALLAKKLARKRGPGGSPSFNSRAEELRAFLHMNWGILQDANDNLIAMEPDSMSIYGFCEPARYRGMDMPRFVGGEWFSANPEAQDVGLVAELRFEDCRRLQAIATFS